MKNINITKKIYYGKIHKINTNKLIIFELFVFAQQIYLLQNFNACIKLFCFLLNKKWSEFFFVNL